MSKEFRIAIIGHGFIGQALFRAFATVPVEVVRVYDRSRANLAGLPPGVAMDDAARFLRDLGQVDLVVESAGAEVSRLMGADILKQTSYMPCSVVALVDELLRARLLSIAKEAGTRLYVPHGAVVGMDNLLEARTLWTSVDITFRKPPDSIQSGVDLEGDEALLFEGSVREIATRYPRSVNAMVACAMATAGLDVTTARMVADRRLGNVLRGEFVLTGSNGSRLTIVKEEPGVGVSGVGMVNSIRSSVLRALGVRDEGLVFV